MKRKTKTDTSEIQKNIWSANYENSKFRQIHSGMLSDLKEEIAAIILKLFYKIEKEEVLLNSYEAIITLILKPDKDAIK